MTPEEIPAEIKEILDRLAGKDHSAEGPVMACLAEILTLHIDLVMRDATMTQWEEMLRDVATVSIDKRLGEITAAVVAKAAYELDRAEKGRRAYATSALGEIQTLLLQEAEVFAKAARIVRGDPHVMLGLVPYSMWTDEEVARVSTAPPSYNIFDSPGMPWPMADTVEDMGPPPYLKGAHVYERSTQRVMVWTGAEWEHRHKGGIAAEETCSFCH